MLRPSRNPLQRFLMHLNPIDLGPVNHAPRWVLEGFATVLEGKLTGSGRPNGAWREVILRTWARAGRLPTYGQLASDQQNWLGMSMTSWWIILPRMAGEETGPGKPEASVVGNDCPAEP